ncbi:IclR family transcriptional regulator [Pseudomaricurvus sp. HS19]|uniref:IclR family transcriptional regulator n=1 Tax=Pseudomaricurvus sp. HS19 TaxID=2692626 RepID=UPI00136EE42C|nr:IclR family transcriptional regulator [Pseudomaricurvus sp. HS19]MYM62426.1 helix-turn-helix domain-containing protein [Pseudomaricurvus sp. HS19]
MNKTDNSQPAHITRGRKLAQAVKDSKAPAISRAAAILRLLGRSDTPLGVQTIARELDLVPSTALNVLRALVTEQFVNMDPDTKRYSLDAGVLTLARQWLGRDQFTSLAQPVLDRLSHTHDVTMLGVQISGLDNIIVVSCSEAGSNFQLRAEVGSRFPVFVSATGRCIAAFSDCSNVDLKAQFDKLRWDEPPAYEEWLQQIEQTREQGFAMDTGNYISGVTVVAVPVWNSRGQLSNALVALGIGSALLRSGLAELQQALTEEARKLSSRLGG